jgi:hypothetical protein
VDDDELHKAAQDVFNASYGAMEHQMGTEAYQIMCEQNRVNTKAIEAQASLIEAKRQFVSICSSILVLLVFAGLVSFIPIAWILFTTAFGD